MHVALAFATSRVARRENQRVVFPGYADLREMSKARQGLLQENVGLGWPTYLRPGNGRMFFQHDPRYQEETHANLNAAFGARVVIRWLSGHVSSSLHQSLDSGL